jgi:hypothetical protein
MVLVPGRLTPRGAPSPTWASNVRQCRTERDEAAQRHREYPTVSTEERAECTTQRRVLRDRMRSGFYDGFAVTRTILPRVPHLFVTFFNPQSVVDPFARWCFLAGGAPDVGSHGFRTPTGAAPSPCARRPTRPPCRA